PAPDGVAHVLAVEVDAPGPHDDRARRQMGPELLAVARGDAGPDEAQREGAVHRPGGHKRVAEALGEETRGGALARPGRAVDRDHRLVSHASSTAHAAAPAAAF